MRSKCCTYLVDSLPMAGADVQLDVVDLIRLRVDLVPPVEAVVVEVLRHLLFVLVHQGAAPRRAPKFCFRIFKAPTNNSAIRMWCTHGSATVTGSGVLSEVFVLRAHNGRPENIFRNYTMAPTASARKS